VVVAEQQVAAVGPEQATRHVDGAQQADDDDTFREPASGKRLRSHTFGRRINKRHSLLGQEHHQPPVTDHVERLHRGVEQQHCHGRILLGSGKLRVGQVYGADLIGPTLIAPPHTMLVSMSVTSV
jgi:hypothetical protein